MINGKKPRVRTYECENYHDGRCVAQSLMGACRIVITETQTIDYVTNPGKCLIFEDDVDWVEI